MVGQLNSHGNGVGETRQSRANADINANGVSRCLRIAMCPPEYRPLQQVMRGEPSDATYIIQGYIAEGLLACGHSLTFIAPRDFQEIVCTDDPQKPNPAPRSWSGSRWFDLVSRNTWRVQQRLGVPYLNVFSNYRLYDACLQCFPGHDLVYERNSLYRVGVAMACQRLRLPYVLYVEADDILEHDIMGKPITGLLRWRAKETASSQLQRGRLHHLCFATEQGTSGECLERASRQDCRVSQCRRCAAVPTLAGGQGRGSNFDRTR